MLHCMYIVAWHILKLFATAWHDAYSSETVFIYLTLGLWVMDLGICSAGLLFSRLCHIPCHDYVFFYAADCGWVTVLPPGGCSCLPGNLLMTPQLHTHQALSRVTQLQDTHFLKCARYNILLFKILIEIYVCVCVCIFSKAMSQSSIAIFHNRYYCT